MDNVERQQSTTVQPCGSEAEFKSRTVMHACFKQVLSAVRCALDHPGDDAIILIVGPTGVGKSRLLERLKSELMEAALDAMLADPGLIPALFVEARKPDSPGPFNWREYYERILLDAKEILIDSKLTPDRAKSLRNPEGYLKSRYTNTAVDLRFAVEQCLRYRQVKTILTDEAQSLAVVSTGRGLNDQMENIKSLANLTRVTHTLAATYAGLSLIQLSGQLCRRITVIEFGRYRPTSTDDADIRAFQNTLHTFQMLLPLQEPPDLLTHWEYLFVNSLGCVGTLKGWLEQALGQALEDKARTLTLTHLERTVKPPQSLLKMYQEIVEGEARIQELYAVSQDTLRALLGFPPRARVLPSSPPATETVPDHGARGGQKKSRPGKRAPSRDVIGVH